MKIYEIFDSLFTIVKEYYKITNKPIFSNLSIEDTQIHTCIYNYLRVEFSEDGNRNLAQNMDTGNQRS